MMVDYFDMVTALTTDYLNVFLVEPGRDSASIVRLDGYVTKGIDEQPEVFSYSKMLSAYAQFRVCDEDRGYFLKILSVEEVLKYFGGGEKKLEFIYRVIQDGDVHYYCAQYIRVKKKADADTLQLVAGFRNVDVLISMMKKIGDEYPSSLLRYMQEYGK